MNKGIKQVSRDLPNQPCDQRGKLYTVFKLKEKKEMAGNQAISLVFAYSTMGLICAKKELEHDNMMKKGRRVHLILVWASGLNHCLGMEEEYEKKKIRQKGEKRKNMSHHHLFLPLFVACGHLLLEQIDGRIFLNDLYLLGHFLKQNYWSKCFNKY